MDGHGQLAFFNGARRDPVLAHRGRLEIGLGADASDLLGLLLPALLLKEFLLLLLPGSLGLDGLVEDFSLGTPLFGSQRNFHYLSGLLVGANAVSDWLAALLQGRSLELALRLALLLLAFDLLPQLLLFRLPTGGRAELEWLEGREPLG